MDVWGTFQSAHGYSLSKRADVEAEGELLGQLWGFGRILSHGLKLLQGTRKELGIRAHLGSCSCSCPGTFLPVSLHLQCAGNPLCGVAELAAFLFTSSGTFRHIPVVFPTKCFCVAGRELSSETQRCGCFGAQPSYTSAMLFCSYFIFHW